MFQKSADSAASGTCRNPEHHVRETCREWIEEKADYCFVEADFIIWGKLHDPQQLGPRCYDHLPEQLLHHLTWNGASSYAAFDLRPFKDNQ